MPLHAEPPEISHVFLSATARDCDPFRQVVREAVRESGARGRSVFLQEDWAKAGQGVVAACKELVDRCDAYIGLFGLRYGWVPPGFDRAITELEFRWAVDRWREKAAAPIFVLLPEAGSEAERRLVELAEQFLHQEYPEEAARERALASHQAFLAAVRAEQSARGLVMGFYGTERKLERLALNCLNNWDRRILVEALEGRREARGEIPLDELGRIGRRRQLRVLEDALEQFEGRRDATAVAVLVHGASQRGQREFAETLYQWDRWKRADRVRLPPLAQAGLEAIVEETCRQLRQPILGAPTLAALVDLLAARLETKSVVILLRRAGDGADRLARLAAEIWQPLRAALVARRAGPGRLMLLVIDQEALPAAGVAGVETGDLAAAGLDYGRLLALPALGEIAESEVAAWLRDAVRDLDLPLTEARLSDIARRATKPGGHPPDVYDRLNNEDFWAGNA